MKIAQLGDMVKGWFVGNFNPTVCATENAEVAVKQYVTGDFEARHHHKIATEITLVLTGAVRMNGQHHGAGSIVVIEPGESTDFECLDDATTVVVKVPGATNDKYPGDSTC